MNCLEHPKLHAIVNSSLTVEYEKIVVSMGFDLNNKASLSYLL